MLTGVPVKKSICDESSNSALPVCQDGVRNWERREEAEGGAWGPRDSRAEIRFMTEASGADGLAWCRPVSNSPDRPFAKEIKKETRNVTEQSKMQIRAADRQQRRLNLNTKAGERRDFIVRVLIFCQEIEACWQVCSQAHKFKSSCHNFQV